MIRAISIGDSALVGATVLSSCGILYGQSKADVSSSEESLYLGAREYLQNNCKENDELTERKTKENFKRYTEVERGKGTAGRREFIIDYNCSSHSHLELS